MIKLVEQAKFRNGATIKEIAELLAVSYQTVYEWMDRSDAFREAVTRARSMQDDAIVDSLYRRASGMTVRETKLDAKGREVTLTRELPPDVDAIALWLTNRRREEWRRREVNAEVNMPIQVNLVGCRGAKGVKAIVKKLPPE